jgi:hypothetical protein
MMQNPFDQFDDAPAAGGFVPLTPANPVRAYDVPKAQAELARAQSQQAQDAATLPYAGVKAAADARRAQAEATLAAAKAARGADVDNSGSAAVRSAALTGYKSAQQLENIVADLRSKYQAGPGSTSGIAGLRDYLPLTANQQFDAAGNAARGIADNALGFTGGQLNTAAEAAMAVGPYLPQASDRDAVILDKIGRLEGLAGLARERSITQLGGVPDDNGNIHPKAALSPSPSNAGSPPPSNGVQQSTSYYGDGGSGGGGIQIATGGTRIEADPARAGVNARVNQMMQSGASDADVQRYVASIGAPGVADAALAFRKKNPTYRGGYGVNLERRQVPMSAGQTTLNAVGAGPVGAYFAGAGDALSAGTLDNMTANPALTRAIQSGIRANNPTASTLGEISGGVLGATGLELGLGAGAARLGGGLGARLLASPVTADALYGAANGAGAADDGNRLLGAGLGAATAGGFGIAGRAAARGVGGAAGGVRDESVRYLRDRGVPLTVGQALAQSGRVGSAVKGIEDRLTGIPVVGDIINGRRREGFEAFNQAAFDQGLAPIEASTGGVVREQGVDLARAARSRAYSDALDPVRVTADAPFVSDMRRTIAAGRALPDPMSGNLDYTLPTRVGNSFDAAGGLTGRDFQQSIRGLRRDAKAVEAQPYGYDFGQVTSQAEGALEGLLGRQAPDALPAYRAANEANRNVEILRDAVNRGRVGTRVGEPGLFAPSQLSDAAAANSKKFGGTHGTTDQPFFDLTRAGQRVLPSNVADSGTAGRLATLALPATLGGVGTGIGYAGGGAQEGAQTGLGLGALLALGGSRRGQQLLTRALIDRPEWLRNAGDAISRRARIGGMFGAGLAPALLSPP